MHCQLPALAESSQRLETGIEGKLAVTTGRTAHVVSGRGEQWPVADLEAALQIGEV